MAGTVQFWTREKIESLKKHRNDSWDDLKKLFGKSEAAIRQIMREHGIKRKRVYSTLPVKYSDNALQVIVDGFVKSQTLRRYAPEDRDKIEKLKNEILAGVGKVMGHKQSVSWLGVSNTAHRLRQKDLKRIGRDTVKVPLRWTSAEAVKQMEENVSVVGSVSAPEVLPGMMIQRRWAEPEELTMDAEAFAKPGYRIGFMSRLDFFSPGFREAMVMRGAEIFCAEGCLFFVINVGLVNKNGVSAAIKGPSAGLKKAEKVKKFEEVLDGAAKGLASMLPRVPHPKEKNKFIRWYISTSVQHDGPYGEEIARRLQMLRPDDIRIHDPQKGPLIVKGIDKRIGVVSTHRNRLPSEYHSNADERAIKDFEARTASDEYDMYAVGGHASSVHNPRGGERTIPYFGIGACHRLQGEKVAENQENVRVLEWEENGSNYFLRTFPLRDWSRNERLCITGIKEGANATHERIVGVIKEIGAVTEGVLEDALDIPREKIKREIQFLVEPKASSRKTWPALYYDPFSQTYDFHPEWIERTLRYPKLSKVWVEHRLLMFACLHAGYTTADYEYFVKKFPEIILARGVDTLVGVGDFIAGLHHDFLCTGQVFGGLNNTEQEIFAAELVATVVMRVFREHFAKLLVGRKTRDSISAEDARQHVVSALLKIVHIVGNHDDWQAKDGSTPLVHFRNTLIAILTNEIQKIFVHMNLPSIDVADVVRSKVIYIPASRPVLQMPSGISMGLHHPYMARAKTSSLRAQEALRFLGGCHVVGIANFHTAIFTESWEPSVGQRIATQVGTMATQTEFEMTKGKRVDFAPLYVRVRVQDGRIIMTETSAFSDPILQDPIPKGTDPEQLKTRLGLLRAR